ncbi:MAG: hypothetical protein QM751_07230 [Paludibacteraceae bacterium]
MVRNMPVSAAEAELEHTRAPVIMSVIIVIPVMGLVPMVAMARAATGAKKKAMSMMTPVATSAGKQGLLRAEAEGEEEQNAEDADDERRRHNLPGRLRSVRMVVRFAGCPALRRAGPSCC